MKKIYLIIISLMFLANIVFAVQAPPEGYWKKALKLSPSQEKRIEKIEQKAQKEYEQVFIKYIRARGCEKDKERQAEFLKIKKKTDREIMKTLNLWQKAKYVEIQSRVY